MAERSLRDHAVALALRRARRDLEAVPVAVRAGADDQLVRRLQALRALQRLRPRAVRSLRTLGTADGGVTSDERVTADDSLSASAQRRLGRGPRRRALTASLAPTGEGLASRAPRSCSTAWVGALMDLRLGGEDAYGARYRGRLAWGKATSAPASSSLCPSGPRMWTRNGDAFPARCCTCLPRSLPRRSSHRAFADDLARVWEVGAEAWRAVYEHLEVLRRASALELKLKKTVVVPLWQWRLATARACWEAAVP